MARSIEWNNAKEWSVKSSRIAAPGKGGRRSDAPSPAIIPPEFLARGVVVDQVLDATPTSARRAAGVPMIDLSVAVGAGESYVLAIRHQSGALTFHGPEVEIARRSARAPAAATFRFRVPLRNTQAGDQRRGLIGNAVKVVLLKVTAKVADTLLPVLAAKAESALWKKAGRSEGWFKLDAASLRSGELRSGAPTQAGPSGRVLLFLHGTFSHAASAFKNLADTRFFTEVQPLYGEQILRFQSFLGEQDAGRECWRIARGTIQSRSRVRRRHPFPRWPGAAQSGRTQQWPRIGGELIQFATCRYGRLPERRNSTRHAGAMGEYRRMVRKFA